MKTINITLFQKTRYKLTPGPIIAKGDIADLIKKGYKAVIKDEKGADVTSKELIKVVAECTKRELEEQFLECNDDWEPGMEAHPGFHNGLLEKIKKLGRVRDTAITRRYERMFNSSNRKVAK